MARPRTELPDRDAILPLIDAEGRIAVRVTPGARTEALTISAGCLLARVRQPPESGKATEAVRQLLAQALNLAPSRLELLRGAASRDKLFRVMGEWC